MNPPFRPGQGFQELLTRRLHELGRHLGDIRSKVRRALVEAIRSAVADMASAAADRVLPVVKMSNQPELRPVDYDPWLDQGEEAWPEYLEQVDQNDAPVRDTSANQSCWLALALDAASWWLREQGTILGAIGVAITVTCAAVLSKRLALDGWPLVEAVWEILRLERLLLALAAVLAKA